MRLRLSINLLFAAFASVAALYGAPDPDLFDGRAAAAGPDSSTTANEADKADGSLENNDSRGASESRGESSSTETAKGSADVERQNAGSDKPGSGASSAEATTSANVSGRSFEEFEVGAVDGTGVQIDINRSKEFGVQSESASGASNRTVNLDVQNSDKSTRKSNSGDQESYDGTGSADYGTSVPSGL